MLGVDADLPNAETTVHEFLDANFPEALSVFEGDGPTHVQADAAWKSTDMETRMVTSKYSVEAKSK